MCDNFFCRYSIIFTESCGVAEDDVEIYEFMQPKNNIPSLSVMYGSVPSPLAHILVDYRNIRHAQIRQDYADAYNTQVPICVPTHILHVVNG